MDQKGCSSPQAIVWLGKENKKIKEKFYKLLSKIAIDNFDQNLAVTNEKSVASTLQLVWGVTPLLIENQTSTFAFTD